MPLARTAPWNLATISCADPAIPLLSPRQGERLFHFLTVRDRIFGMAWGFRPPSRRDRSNMRTFELSTFRTLFSLLDRDPLRPRPPHQVRHRVRRGPRRLRDLLHGQQR